MTKNLIHYRAPALSRGLAILEHLGLNNKAKTMKQLCSELNFSYNEVFRIVRILELEGYLYQDANRYYHLTDKLKFTHSNEVINSFSESDSCQKLMKKFTWQTNQSCHLATILNGVVQVITHQQPNFGLSISARDGSLLNTIKSSSALLLLAMSDEKDSWSLLRNHTLDLPLRAQLHDELVKIQKNGYAEVAHDRIIGLNSISYPVYYSNKIVKLVITCPSFQQKPSDHNEIKNSLLRLAEDLSIALVQHLDI
ncbi:helix-turn-helix domain-containing protein [Providencia vermicola]|uniref:IclR family transcriptional regulator n=1 Tax=Providencia vermicola TaxID=333965 RepID=UPI001CEC9280|nr:helix-turn-helix domain-containing protein [Providencia vermicola]